MTFLLVMTYMPQMAFAGSDNKDSDTAASSKIQKSTDNDDKDAKVIENENTTGSTTFDLGDWKKGTVFFAMMSDSKMTRANWSASKKLNTDMEMLELKSRETFRKNYLDPACSLDCNDS